MYGDGLNYAFGPDGAIVKIGEINPKDRYSLGPYNCPGCGSELVPALGKIRAHHFKHKLGRDPSCSNETYLHHLAKHVLRDALQKAIDRKAPYYLTTTVPRICDYYKKDLEIVCTESSILNNLDLTRWFDTAEVEKEAGGYIADVLLSSKERVDYKLLLEIEVTHPCEPEKIASGQRIVEIKIENEDDIDKLRHGIDLRRSGTLAYNFKDPKALNQRCDEPCDIQGSAFFVFKSGKTLILNDSIDKIIQTRSRQSTVYFQFLGLGAEFAPWDYTQIYFEESVKAAYKHNVPVKSCLLCQKGGLGKYEEAIFCFEKSIETKISTAAECKFYKVDTTEANARRRFERSLKYLETQDIGLTSNLSGHWNTSDDTDVIE